LIRLLLHSRRSKDILPFVTVIRIPHLNRPIAHPQVCGSKITPVVGQKKRRPHDLSALQLYIPEAFAPSPPKTNCTFLLDDFLGSDP